MEEWNVPGFGKRTDPTVEDEDVEFYLHTPDFRKRKLWTDPRVEDDVEVDLRPSAEIPLKQLQIKEEITRGVGQFTLPKQPVTTGGHDPIQLDDTESEIMEDYTNMVTMEGQATMVTMEGQANNVIMKVKSLVAVDDVTATDGVENTREGFIRLYLILSLFLLLFCCVSGNQTKTKVDWQSDSLLHVFGGTWNLKCSKNDSIENETCIWSRRDLKSGITDTINFGTTPNNPAKFKIIDDGSTLEIKNLTEEDITDYCYYSRMGTTPSECKRMLDENNTVVIPSRTTVTFPMNKTIWLQSGCYPNLTFFMIIQGSVVANQTSTKKDNGLYEVDMTYNGTLKNGEQLLVIAHHGNKNFTVYNSTDVQIIKHEEDSSRINIQLIIVVAVVSIVVISIVLVYIIYKWRRWRGDINNKTKNGEIFSMESLEMLRNKEPNGCLE